MSKPIALRRRSRLALLLPILTAFAGQPAWSDDRAIEHSYLAGVLRQMDMAERLAQHGADVAVQQATRYHFDYPRLQEDVERIRQGIHDYLSPSRAQPRDGAALWGDYQRDDESVELPTEVVP